MLGQNDINKSIVIGRLTKIPKIKSTHSGALIVSFSIASNKIVRKLEDYVNHANFFNVTCFGFVAENVARYLEKGQKVIVDGELRYSAWEYNFKEYSKIEIIAESVQFLDKPQTQESESFTRVRQDEFHEEEVPS